MAAPSAADVHAALATIAAAAEGAVAPAVADAKTVGQALDADVAALKVKVAALETGAVAFVKTNWAHFVTWFGLLASSGVLSSIVKHFI